MTEFDTCIDMKSLEKESEESKNKSASLQKCRKGATCDTRQKKRMNVCVTVLKLNLNVCIAQDWVGQDRLIKSY